MRVTPGSIWKRHLQALWEVMLRESQQCEHEREWLLSEGAPDPNLSDRPREACGRRPVTLRGRECPNPGYPSQGGRTWEPVIVSSTPVIIYNPYLSANQVRVILKIKAATLHHSRCPRYIPIESIR